MTIQVRTSELREAGASVRTATRGRQVGTTAAHTAPDAELTEAARSLEEAMRHESILIEEAGNVIAGRLNNAAALYENADAAASAAVNDATSGGRLQNRLLQLLGR